MRIRRAVALLIVVVILCFATPTRSVSADQVSEGQWAERYNSLQLQIQTIEAQQEEVTAQREQLQTKATTLKVHIDRFVRYVYKDTGDHLPGLDELLNSGKKEYFSAAVRTKDSLVKHYLSVEDRLAKIEAQQELTVTMLNEKRDEAAKVRQWLQDHPARVQDGASHVELMPSTVTAPNAQVAIVIEFAKAQLGKPYVFATSGPLTYDCSGLTAAAWAVAGYSLAHYSGAQYHETRPVSFAELLPGDLVFYGSGGSRHVSLYVGDGLVISAPHSGAVVRVQTLVDGAVGYGRVWS